MFCKRCNSEKEAREFYAHVASRCKDCHKRRMKEIRLTDPAVQERDRKRAKRPDRKARSRANVQKWRTEHPEAYKAQSAVGNALRDGRLRKLPCEVCGSASSVHAHHSDYSKPLFVRWLCAKCHHRLHAIFPQLRGHHDARE